MSAETQISLDELCGWCAEEILPGQMYTLQRGIKLHIGECRDVFIQECCDE